MRLQNLPTGSLGRVALGLLALLCVLYALYIAFLMPPLVKYGTAGAKADGRMYCTQRRLATENQSYIRDFPDGKNGIDRSKMNQAHSQITRELDAEYAQLDEAECLSETAVNIPLLDFRAIVLLIVGAISCFAALQAKGNPARLPTNPLLRVVLNLVALLCVVYALYIALLMPPLVKYGTAGGLADGRTLCPVIGRRAADALAKAKSIGGSVWDEITYGDGHPEEMKQVTREAEGACLAESAVNTPLLVFRAAVLLVIGAAAALMASRLKMNG